MVYKVAEGPCARKCCVVGAVFLAPPIAAFPGGRRIVYRVAGLADPCNGKVRVPRRVEALPFPLAPALSVVPFPLRRRSFELGREGLLLLLLWLL